MKQSNLISILILFFTLLNEQSVVGQYYSYEHSAEHELMNGWGTKKDFNTGTLPYPSNQIYFEAYVEKNVTSSHKVKVLGKEYELNTNPKTSWGFHTGEDDALSNNPLKTTIDFTTSTNAITFTSSRDGAQKIYIKNIKVRMAPHTILNTKSLSFNTALTDPDGETQTIDFYSFLTGSQGMKISIVDVKDKDGNPITIEGLSLNRTSVEENVLEKIGENKYSFTLTFEPKQIITNVKCIIRINNPGAVDNPTLDIPVTLNSTLEVPTLNLDASGYTFAKLSWNAIEGAESYNVYDGDTKIGNYTTTTATITGLNYNTNHSYTVTSVVGSAESNKQTTPVTVNCPAYPSITGISTNAEQNQVTVNWNAVTITPTGHTVKQYYIHLYQPSTDGTFIDATTTTGTSCTFTGLTDNTQYTVYIDVEYQYTLNGVNITDTDWLWSSKSFTTTSFTPSDAFDGVFMYQGKWYRANLNSNIRINDGYLDSKDAPYEMKLLYPCESNINFQINTSSALGIYGDATIKIDETTTGNWDDTNNIHKKSYRGENQLGTATTSNFNIKALKFYCDGGSNANEYVHDIKLQIASHTKMYTESVSFNTPVTNTNPDEQKIEFQSVLTANNGLKFEIVEKDGNNTYKATTLSNDVITLYLNNSYKGQSFHIQSNNTLVKHKDTNKAQGKSIVAAGGWDVTIKFKPNNLFEKEVFVRITNEGAKVNPVIYIPVTLKSSLETPTLKCDASGYTFAKLSWNAVEDAEKYNLYDGNTLVGTYTTTSATKTGLEYGSSHSYSVSSVVGSAVSDKSTPVVTVNCPAYPTVKNLTVSDIQTDKVTINWEQEDRIANHSYPKYHILVYENGTLKKELETTNTSITIDSLKNTTSHTVKVGVEYYYELNGTQTVSPDKKSANQWVSKDFSTKDPLTEAPYNEPYNGVINYKGTWYYVNLNNDINITSNPMPIKLGYPCNYLKFKAVTEGVTGALSVNNSVGVKQDEVHTYAMPEWSFSNEEHDGNTEIKTTTEAVSLYMYSGTATEVSQLKVRNIWLTIEPHILLKETKYVTKLTTNSTKTETTTAEIDFGEIEIDYNKQVNINFKSFLSVGDMNAEITIDENNVFSLNEGEKEHYIAGNNTLEEVYSNDHSFTITFNPTEAKEENYTGTLVIKDNKHTLTITLKGKCIKRTPEITWVNDKYISLGEYLAGAAYSTCGTVKYELVDPNNSNIIGIDNELNLLEGKEKGEKVEIIAKVEASDKWEEAKDTATFTVTDNIIQAIRWEQNFTILKTINQKIELTAEAITRETGERNGNEITYSTTDSTESVVKIVDGKLQIVGSGYTYITAHQQGNNEYAPTYMTKLVFVIETAGDTKNCMALEDTQEKTYGNGEILSTQGGLNWGPFEFEETLTTLGDKLSFKTTKVTGQTFNTTGDYLIITDDLGNLVYNSNLGKTETNIQLPDPEAKKLFFTLGGNLKVSISDIKVTPAKYITPDKNSIAFSETKVDNKSIEEIDFDWANQPDFIIATIEDDEAGVFSVDTKTAIFGNPECGEYGTSTVKVIFSPKEETNYTANLVLYVGDKQEPQKIPITGQGKKAEQSIYWLNISDLTTADKEINLAHTSASTQQPITYTIISDENKVVQLNDDHTIITIVGEGTFTLQAKQEGNTSYYATEITEAKEFTATIGNLIFDNKEKDNEWTTNRNWKPESRLNLRRNIAPSEDVEINLSIEDTLIIKNNTNIETDKNLSIKDKGTINIEPKGRFKVNTINEATADNLTLQSSVDGNAAFVYTSGNPSATVEMYSEAQYGTTATDGHHPEWQYVGVAVNGAKVGDFKYNNERTAWLLKWEEKDNVSGDPWSDAPLLADTTLVPWAGYSISQPTDTTYSMKGSLMRGDHTYTLTRTTREGDTQDPDCGFNLLANSYTAPIDIAKLEPSNFVGADACIVLFNTGTYADWESQKTTLGENPGQLTAIPVVTGEAAGLTTTIASMQAFFVKAKENNATFSVDYETAVAGATNHGNLMRAPQAEREFNVLKITIEGENSRDRLFLLENEETSKAYDNGYEARKIFDAPRGHQMYATCEYGYASIDCSESIVGQTIGLKGDNEGEILTISFDTDRLEGYSSLYLYDKVTGKYVNILSNEKYTFFGIKGADDNRFSIVTNPDDKAQTPPFVIIGNELAFDKSQIDANNANIYIYDTSGRLLMTDKINPGENYRIPDMPEGIYLVSMNGYTTKIVRK